MTAPTTSPQFTPPAPSDADEVEIRDFTLRRKRIMFRVGEHTFEAHRALGIELMQELVKVVRTISAGTQENASDEDLSAHTEKIAQVFDKLLLPDSAVLFRQHVGKLDVREQLIPILYYVMEKFGIRPTEPSSGSPAG